MLEEALICARRFHFSDKVKNTRGIYCKVIEMNLKSRKSEDVDQGYIICIYMLRATSIMLSNAGVDHCG